MSSTPSDIVKALATLPDPPSGYHWHRSGAAVLLVEDNAASREPVTTWNTDDAQEGGSNPAADALFGLYVQATDDARSFHVRAMHLRAEASEADVQSAGCAAGARAYRDALTKLTGDPDWKPAGGV